MVIVGVLLIVAVLLDAYRRVRTERRARVRVAMAGKVSAESTPEDEALLWLKELPNGGARVVERRDILRATNEAREKNESNRAVAEEAESRSNVEESATEDEVDLVKGMTSQEGPENLDWLDDMGSADSEPARRPGKEVEEPVRLPRSIDPEVFMLNVASRNPAGFGGEDILHILLACDLRFGDMNFFHRHEQEAGRGPIQFSVANMVQPGVFDIDNMADFNTPGLVFFLTLPGPEDMMQAFDYMLETAQAVARNLGGDVLDESRSVMTRQTLEHCRQQIRDLERRMLTSATR